MSGPAAATTFPRSLDEIRVDSDGVPERFGDGKAPNIMPTHAALLTFARNCGTEYVYVFDDGEWHCHKL